MATAGNVHLTVGDWPAYYRSGISEKSANTASHLLQTNHESHHIFFNRSGFHNHIAHHLLTVYALKASPAEIQQAYDVNAGYQRAVEPIKEVVVDDMHDPVEFKGYLGKEKYYHDFLVYFQGEMESLGWQEAVNKYLFARDERADDLLERLFAGFLHPIIHLGFGIEFHQPAIVAEALAQAAVHDSYMGDFFKKADSKAAARSSEQSKSIVQLLDEIKADATLCEAPRWSDGNKLRDGILKRAGERMINYASQYRVALTELEQKTAEMTNAVCWYTAGAQRTGKSIKYDFYLMHCVNCSVFFSAFLNQDWISEANKVRLLEWKVRSDLAMYASRKSPEVKFEEVRQYRPKKPSGWDGIMDRVNALEDDGHASKLVRALANGQKICEAYEDREEFRVKHDDWLRMGHMAIDSVEAGEPHWVRSAGFDEAWKDIPARAQL